VDKSFCCDFCSRVSVCIACTSELASSCPDQVNKDGGGRVVLYCSAYYRVVRIYTTWFVVNLVKMVTLANRNGRWTAGINYIGWQGRVLVV
jgi:hypothetical protein